MPKSTISGEIENYGELVMVEWLEEAQGSRSWLPLVRVGSRSTLFSFFVVKRWHTAGPIGSRSWATKWTAGHSDLWGPRTGCLELGWECWAPHYWALAIPLVKSMAFEPNNCNIGVFGLEGFTWVIFGLLNNAEIPHNKPKWFIGHHIGYFCGLGSMGHFWKYFIQVQLIIGDPFEHGCKK